MRYKIVTVVALYQTVQNELEGGINSQVVDRRTMQRTAIEEKLQIKSYTEKFINQLNDYSIFILARKEGVTAKDWRI